ncbi:S-layer homology domain-containing protein [Paenibacillus cymbidii]|uniref:S-layer homology domain-containing protein n=1 Tax=Paenibacillus cymbidii TaxID=1639034 RepID=UPI001081E414|nr:S-layer homology domain-containing protein [Paenibacillus cymbidii]
MKQALATLLVPVLLLCALGAAFGAPAPARAASGNRIDLAAGPGSAEEGGTFKATVRGTQATDLYALQYTLEYDETELQLVGIAYKNGYAQSAAHEAKSGHLVRNTYALLNNTITGAVKASLDIAEMTFQALKPGSAAITLEGLLAYDSSSGNMDTINENTRAQATITIVARQTPETPTPTPTSTPTPAVTPTPTPNVSPTPIVSATPSVKPSATPSVSPTPTDSPTPSVSPMPVAVTPVVSADGTAVGAISRQAYDEARQHATKDAKGNTVVSFRLDEAPGAKAYAPQLPTSVFASGSSKEKVQIETPMGSLSLPGDMFKKNDLAGAANVAVSIALVDADDVTDPKLKNKIGDRPVVELNVSADGEAVKWNNPKAPVTVSVRYTPTAAEMNDPDFGTDFIAIWYIDGKGKSVKVPNARYDAETGAIVFTTTHFSKYAVAYEHATFGDLGDTPWAQAAVEALASKGAMEGTAEGMFRPAANITRADFVGALVLALGLSAEEDANFADIPADRPYAAEIGIAKQLGVSQGIGDNRFAPDSELSRQDMMVLTARAMRLAGMLDAAGDTADLAGFFDRGDVADYAVESIAALVRGGVIEGEGDGVLNPLGPVTRAAAAAAVYRTAGAR